MERKKPPVFRSGLFLLLSLGALFLSFPFPARAQNESDEGLFQAEEEIENPEWREEMERKLRESPLRPEEYVVSGAKHPQRLSESPSAITVINAEEIRAYGVFTVEELLRIVPGVDLKEVSPAFKILGIRSFHTSSGNTVLVLVDGQEINLNLFGGVFWSMLPISLDDIKRIEVIRGPGSALYGANAHCGVINIVTKNPRELKPVTLLGDFGAYDLEPGIARAKLKLAHSLSRISFSVSADLDRAQSWDYPDQNEYKMYRTRFLSVAEPTGWSRIQFDGGWFTGDQHSYIYFGDMHFTNQYSYYLNTIASWKNLKFQAYWRRYQTDVTIRTPVFYLGPIFEGISTTLDNLEGRLEYNLWLPARNHLILGATYLFNVFNSEALVHEYNDEERQGFYLQDEWNPFPSLLLTLGFRFDHNSITDRPFPKFDFSSFFKSISPRISAVYSLYQYHSLRASFGQAFRKPSFFEYGLRLKNLADTPFSNWLFSKDLKNERLLSWEIGYTGRLFRFLEVNADLFYQQQRDALVVSAEGDYSYTNYPRYADAAGVELAFKFFLLENLDGFANYAFDYTWDHSSAENPIFQRLETLYPHHKLNLGLKARPAPNLNLSGSFHYVSATWDFIMDPAESIIEMVDTPDQELGPQYILNFRAGYKVWPDYLEVGLKGFHVLSGGSAQFPRAVWRHPDPETGEEIEENFTGEKVRRAIIFFLEASY